jgi:proteasomal ATPase-associated factor 1
VILSGASDFQLRIWSALDGSNPVTLKGHTKGVTDSAIIDKGRNVLCKFIFRYILFKVCYLLIFILTQWIASARDGTIRLWECGIYTIKLFSSISNLLSKSERFNIL